MSENKKATHRGDIAEGEVIAARREMVAELRLRRMTFRAIASALEHAGHVNPESGKAWHHQTIAEDCQALIADWKERGRQEFDERRACLLAELDETKRAAWAKGEHEVVLRAIKAEREMLGLDAPTRAEVTGANGESLAVQIYLPAKDAPVCPTK